MSFESMKTRIGFHGGAAQQDRMIKDKWKSMLSATKYSYQAARFTKYPEMDKTVDGLFNPVTQNLNFDTKMISTGFDSGYRVGDIFLWENTKTFWICYSQDLTELAYFRGKCRRCDYKVKWVDGDRKVLETYLSVVGPNQPDFRTQLPGYGLSIDTATADLTVLASNNEQNKLYFNQYQSFLLNGINYKIHQIDNLSLPGIIQMNCVQSTNNLIEDDVEKNIKNSWNIQPIVPQHTTQEGIDGPISIKPLFPFEFTALRNGGRWFILEDQGQKVLKNLLPIKFNSDINSDKISLTWTSPNSGAFTLCYGIEDRKIIFKKHIIVESLM